MPRSIHSRLPEPEKPKKAKKPVRQKTGSGILTPKMLRFVDEYCVDFNGSKAAQRAGYPAASSRSMASQLLAREDVAEEVKKRQARQQDRTAIRADTLLKELWSITTADANELVEYRRHCCRHCWGINYGYQRTVAEMNRELEQYNVKRSKMVAKGADPDDIEPFDEQGGIGYDKRRDPNPDCQECFGVGEGQVIIKDTRKLSPEARAVYGGVKVTKDGVQIILVDKLAAAEKMAKHLGIYKEDNDQKADALAEFLQSIQARNTKLPIKPEGGK